MEKNPLKGRNQHELKELGKEAVRGCWNRQAEELADR